MYYSYIHPPYIEVDPHGVVSTSIYLRGMLYLTATQDTTSSSGHGNQQVSMSSNICMRDTNRIRSDFSGINLQVHANLTSLIKYMASKLPCLRSDLNFSFFSFVMNNYWSKSNWKPKVICYNKYIKPTFCAA